MLITFLLGKNLQDNFENYYEILAFHNSFGILIFILAIFRITWRFINIKPDALPNKIIFEISIFISYNFISFFVMPLTGYLLTNLQGDMVSFFGTSLPNILKEIQS